MGRLFISLAGNPSAGKSELAQHLQCTYGFAAIRPSNLIKRFADQNGNLLRERKDYIANHLQMIETYGPDYVVDIIVGVPSDLVCIDGERIVRHIEELRRKVGVKVLALWCPQEIRYARSLSRGADRDKTSLRAFAQDEAQEYQSPEPPYASVMTVMQMADYHLDASKPQTELHASADKIVEQLLI